MPNVTNMKDVKLLLLGILLLSIQLKTATLEMTVTCEAGRFNVGDTASVTCIFHENVKESSPHVYITFYPFNSSESEDIFRCTWTNQTIQSCTVEEGFRFNGNISDQLKVEIPGVTANFSGRYVCQLVTAEPRPLSMCNLTVEETLTTPEEKTATGLSTTVIAALSSLIPITIIVMIVLAAVYIRVIRQRRQRLLEVTNGEHIVPLVARPLEVTNGLHAGPRVAVPLEVTNGLHARPRVAVPLEVTNGLHAGPRVAVPLEVTNGEHAGPRVARSVKWAENATDDFNWEILSGESSDEDIEVPGIHTKSTRSVESATTSEGSSSSYHTASDNDRLSPCSRDEEDER